MLAAHLKASRVITSRKCDRTHVTTCSTRLVARVFCSLVQLGTRQYGYRGLVRGQFWWGPEEASQTGPEPARFHGPVRKARSVSLEGNVTAALCKVLFKVTVSTLFTYKVLWTPPPQLLTAIDSYFEVLLPTCTYAHYYIHVTFSGFVAVASLGSGYLIWFLQLNADIYESDPELEKIRKDQGYSYTDIITIHQDTLPNYEEKVWWELHTVAVHH